MPILSILLGTIARGVSESVFGTGTVGKLVNIGISLAEAGIEAEPKQRELVALVKRLVSEQREPTDEDYAPFIARDDAADSRIENVGRQLGMGDNLRDVERPDFSHMTKADISDWSAKMFGKDSRISVDITKDEMIAAADALLAG